MFLEGEGEGQLLESSAYIILSMNVSRSLRAPLQQAETGDVQKTYQPKAGM